MSFQRRPLLAAAALAVAIGACGEADILPPPPPTGSYELVTWLDRPLPVQIGVRGTVGGTGFCHDTLRRSTLVLDAGGSAERRWYSDVWCDGAGAPAEAHMSGQVGTHARLPDGRIVVSFPLAGTDESTHDTLTAIGDRLRWIIPVQLSTEHGPGGIDTMTSEYRRIIPG